MVAPVDQRRSQVSANPLDAASKTSGEIMTTTFDRIRSLAIDWFPDVPIAKITPDAHLFDDLGLDVFDFAALRSAVELEFAITFDDDLWIGAALVGDLTALIDAQRRADERVG